MKESNDIAGVIAKPPFIYLLFLIIGIVLNFIWKIKLIPDILQYSLGFSIIIIGFIIMITGLKQFKKAGTHHETHKPTIKIVAHGMYKYSRNPIYIGLTLFYLGIGIASDNIWILILIIPALIVMQYGVILREEKYLEKKFGEEYLQYKAKVRRWL